jgi:hypothetical protein
MPTYRDPSTMTPDERRGELTAIFALGISRRRQLEIATGGGAKSPSARLDVPLKTVLIGRVGLTDGETR